RRGEGAGPILLLQPRHLLLRARSTEGQRSCCSNDCGMPGLVSIQISLKNGIRFTYVAIAQQGGCAGDRAGVRKSGVPGPYPEPQCNTRFASPGGGWQGPGPRPRACHPGPETAGPKARDRSDSGPDSKEELTAADIVAAVKRRVAREEV